MNKFKKFISVFALLYIVILPLYAGGEGQMALINGTNPISMAKAQALLGKDGVHFLDVNTKEQQEEYGFLPGAIFINVPEYEKLLPSNKDDLLIIYGINRLSYTSAQAAIAIKELGYKNIYVMPDGLEAWIISGRPIQNTEVSAPKKISDFKDGIHSQMIFGQIPSCRDCHGAKNTLKKNSVNTNCTICHKEIGKEFDASVHSKTAKSDVFKQNTKHGKPQCTDCHAIHTAEFPSLLNYKQASDKKCGSCHEKQQQHYYETFHGKAMFLNRPGTAPTIAACFDCHGTHNIYRPTDAHSTLSIENRAKTCSTCHINSNDDFSLGFIAHADHNDAQKYPELYYAYIFMSGLLILVFGFFGLHTLLWSVKLISLKIKYPKEFKEAKQKSHDHKIRIRRFSTLNIIMHFFVAASFLGLAFSGLPQKFYTAPWAQSMINLMGGIENATLIHHISAFIMGVCFVVHIIEIIIKIRKNPDFELFGSDSLMPRVKDIKDMYANIKWFIGIGEKPQFDRWTYWEKFDYLAVFWGMFVIGFSGLVLWFPTFFASFLPGWFINLSTIIHSDEALLATGFIFAIHFFNTHFRADRFPMDTVIFSGHLSEYELKAERKDWYDRLKSSNKLEGLIVKNDKFNSYSKIAKLAGFAMLITGLIFLALIIYAFIA